MLSIYRTLLKLARKVGPAALMAVVRYGPQLQRMVKDNPNAFKGLTNRFSKVTKAKDSGSLEKRVHVLREQVTYLYASANTAEAARQAATWRTELEAIEKVLPVLGAMSRRQQSVERRAIVREIDRLSSQILAASLVDAVEDAEVVGESESESEDPRAGKAGPTEPDAPGERPDRTG